MSPWLSPYAEGDVGRLAMSTTEVRRWVVMRRVRDGELTLREAATLLRRSYRQVKRIWRRFRLGGPKALRHASLGRRSNRARPAAERTRVLALVAAHFSGPATGAGQRFGPTLVAEHLAEEFQVVVPVATLRRWMVAEGLWSRRRHATPPHPRRLRRPHFGELVQLDGSVHDWLEGRAPAGWLLTMVDDATSRTLGLFTDGETTWGAAQLLERWIANYGVPQALYVDAKTVFVRPATKLEALTGEPPETQFGRMCRKLGIRLIVAKTPQAKGRVERVHGTHQDRLIKKLRRMGIADYAAANRYLTTTYYPAHNARFAVAPAAPADFHLPLDPRLDRRTVFCVETPRVLGRDWVVRYDTRLLHVVPTRAAQRVTGPRQRVVVRETESGELTIIAAGPLSAGEVLEWRPVPTRGATAPASPVPPAPTRVTPVAGYTRAGKPLSPKQMELRARWSASETRRIDRHVAKKAQRQSKI